MNPHIQVGVAFIVLGKIDEPGAWYHNTSRANSTACKSFVGGIVDRLCQPNVIGMYNKQFGIGSVTQFFRQGLLSAGLNCKKDN